MVENNKVNSKDENKPKKKNELLSTLLLSLFYLIIQ